MHRKRELYGFSSLSSYAMIFPCWVRCLTWWQGIPYVHMINTLSITLRLGKISCVTYDFMNLLLMRKTQASNASLLPLLALSWTINSNCSNGNVFTTRYYIKRFYFYCINYCVNGGLLSTIRFRKKVFLYHITLTNRRCGTCSGKRSFAFW